MYRPIQFQAFVLIIMLNGLFGACKRSETVVTPPPAVDPCAGISCGTKGQCQNGACVCATGYTGDKCQTEKVPKTIRVEEIYFYIPSPCTDFDAGDGLNYEDADPYVAFYYNNVKKFDTRSLAPENKNFATVNVDFTFDNTDRVWEVRYYDKDGTTDLLIGTYTFKPYDPSRSPNFPNVIQAIKLEQRCEKGNYGNSIDTRLFLNRATYTY